MEKIIFKAIAYEKGRTGRKGKITLTAELETLNEAKNKLHFWIEAYNALYLYEIKIIETC